MTYLYSVDPVTPREWPLVNETKHVFGTVFIYYHQGCLLVY